MNGPTITRTTCARIPTEYGQFQLCHYLNSRDRKEHLAFIMGDVAGRRDLLVRVHSECFTGDVLGSQRCDCGQQLAEAMRLIAETGAGMIIYLRQEGRGIGLEQKLRAYNLQDEGYDTVDANLMLGHQADEREYWMAAAILADLDVQSIRLLTNNPAKIDHLSELGVAVSGRVPVIPVINQENQGYLSTKVQRMNHLLDVSPQPPQDVASLSPAVEQQMAMLQQAITRHEPNKQRPFVTLSYAQSLDGSIAATPGRPLPISSEASMTVTHALRASHEGILVGIGTILADDPRLTVRLWDGPSPRPVVLDSRLRTPLGARLLNGDTQPIIATACREPAKRAALEAQGAHLLDIETRADGHLDLDALLYELHCLGMGSLMVEGGSQILSSFLSRHLVDYLVITVAPLLVGGVHALNELADNPPRIAAAGYTPAGGDLILWGEPVWATVAGKSLASAA